MAEQERRPTNTYTRVFSPITGFKVSQLEESDCVVLSLIAGEFEVTFFVDIDRDGEQIVSTAQMLRFAARQLENLQAVWPE